MKKVFVLSFVLLSSFLIFSTGSANAQITIDNDITGDNQWEVDVLNGGESNDGRIDPVGPDGLTDIIYDYFFYVDPGADGGGIRLSGTTITTPEFLSNPDEVTSAGNFAGSNAAINWNAVASISNGSTIYQVTFTFTSSMPFGTVRFIVYLDEDVEAVGDDILIVQGTAGADDFQLLTIDGVKDIGLAQSAAYSTATGMSYIGWTADKYSDLRSAITGAGASYSIGGFVDTTDLAPTTDPRFPGAPAYGPEDITTALAFDLNPSATAAAVTFFLGFEEAEPESVIVPIPTVTQWGMIIFTVLAGLGAVYYMRREKSRKIR